MIEKERWPPNNSPNSNDMETSCLGATHKAILKLSPEEEVSESKVALGQIPQVQLTICPKFKKNLTRVGEG